MARARNLLCPYCFNRWSTHIAAFRCLSTDVNRCALVPDEAQGKLLGIEAPVSNRVIRREGRWGMAFAPKPGNPVRCDCGAPTHPVCPLCFSRLPQLFTDAAGHSMALIGTKASGKSHFVAVALHELDHRVGPRLNGSLMLLDEYTRDRVTKELLPRLYEQRTVLEPTQSAVNAAAGTGRPLAAQLAIGAGRDIRHSNLIFFDAAGEDLEQLSIMERQGRYVTQSDGLLLLIDPLQISAVRDRLNGSVELPEVARDVHGMLTRLAALLREAHAIPASRPIPIPLALTVSKLDAIRNLLPETSPVLSASRHDGAFDRRDAKNVSDTMRAEVASWLGDGFDRFVQQNFTTVGYFGVSALGENPAGGRLTHGVAPHRIEDPVLWMLDQWGAVPARND
jgi:hypothetical protein